MRCREGDNAMVVGGFRDNWGSVVKVLRRHSTYADVWVVRVQGRMYAKRHDDYVILEAGEEACLTDKNLRPLHGGDGIDEMIVIAGLPKDKWHG